MYYDGNDVIFLHIPKTLNDLKQIFKPHPIALKLDQYIKKECIRLGTSIVNFDFIYDRETKEFKPKGNHINIGIQKSFDKLIK